MTPIFLDATAIDCFLTCREAYRRRYLFKISEEQERPGIIPVEPSIYLSFGHAVHTAVELWHKGNEYEECLHHAAIDMEEAGKKLEGRLRPDMEIKWRELGLALPECVAVYCDGVEPASESEIEQEWMVPLTDNVTLCGKIDRYHKHVHYDVKTASEVGKTWKADYRSTLLRTFQFGLYDWYLKTREDKVRPESELTGPVGYKIEVIVKPYRGKPARLEVFDLPEIRVYRKRFKQQLAWVVSEIEQYHYGFADTFPWPMAGSQTCQGKFSACDYLKICNQGDTPRVLEGYREREEHLEILRIQHQVGGGYLATQAKPAALKN